MIKHEMIDYQTEQQLQVLAQYNVNIVAALTEKYDIHKVAEVVQVLTDCEKEMLDYLIDINLKLKQYE